MSILAVARAAAPAPRVPSGVATGVPSQMSPDKALVGVTQAQAAAGGPGSGCRGRAAPSNTEDSVKQNPQQLFDSLTEAEKSTMTSCAAEEKKGKLIWEFGGRKS